MASLVTTTVAGDLTVTKPNSGGTTAQQVQKWTQTSQNTLLLNMYGGATDLVQLAATNAEQNISIVTEASASLSATTVKGIYIKSGGSVGVGTPNPTAKLHVQGDDPQIRIGDNAGTNKFIDIRSNNGNAEFVSRDNAAHGTFKFITEAGTTELTRMTILANGDINMVGASNTNLFLLDASADSIGIGEAPVSNASLYVAGSKTYPLRVTTTNAQYFFADSIIYANSANGMYLVNQSSYLRFGENDAELMRLTGGKVGIGTNVPAERLHVYKSGTDTPLRVEATGHVGVELKGGISNDIYFLLADTSTNAKIGWDHSATALKFNASASFSDNHLVVKSTGVGIGTDAPGQLLHVYKAGVLEPNFQSTTGRVGLQLNAGAAGDVSWILYSGYPAAGDFNIRESGVANHFVIKKTTGSVGIGTATPSADLQVHSGDILITSGRQEITNNAYSNAAAAMLVVQGPSTGNPTLSSNQWGIMIGPQHNRATTANSYYPGIAFNMLLNHNSAATYNNAPNAWIGTRLHDTAGSERAFLVFSTKGGTGVTASDVPLERMCIDPVNGSVGIGTTDPAAELQIGRPQTTSAFTDSFIKLRPSSTTNSTGLTSITFGTSTVDNYGYSISGWRAGTDGAPYLAIKYHNNSAAGVDAMVMDNLGNVGIGSNAPPTKFHVLGNTGHTQVVNIKSTLTTGGCYMQFTNATADLGYFGWGSAANNDLYVVNNGGSNTGNINIYAGSATRLTVGSNGNVNINDGNFTIASGHLLYLDGGVDTYIYEDTANSISIATNSTVRMTLNHNGVGIGTGTPHRNVHIYQAADGNQYEGALQVGGNSASVGGYFGYNSLSSGRLTISSLNNAGGANAKVYLGFGLDTDGSPAKEVMTLTQEGKVIIGGNAPTKTFEVKYASSSTNVTGEGLNGGGAGTGLLIFNTQESNSVYANLDFRARNADGRIAYQYQTATNVGDFHFITDNTGSPQSMMTIRNDGNVGIGTQSPAAKLQIVSDGSHDEGAEIFLKHANNNSTDIVATILFGNNSGGVAKIESGTTGANNTGYISYFTDNAGTSSEKMRIIGDGNVGIGTATPANLLNLYSGTDISPSNGATGQFMVQGNGYKTFLAMDGTAAYFGHNSSARSLVFMTNETARLSITGSGAATFSSTLIASGGFYGNGSGLTSLNGSNISSGTVAAARLGSGSSITTKFLRGDNTWQTVSGGGGDTVSITTSAADILSVSSGAISAVDAGSGDRIVFWDNGSNKLAYLDNGDGLSFSGTNLVVTDRVKRIYKGSTSSGTYVSPDSSGYLSFYEGTGMQLSFSGNSITFSTTSSDYRLKKNISTFNSEAWTKVKSVNLRKFDFDEDAYKTAIASPDREITEHPKNYFDNLGFIAHELAEAEIKEAVTGEKDGIDEDGNFIYQKVNYLALVPVLWGALKEAISKIETLESKVQALEDK